MECVIVMSFRVEPKLGRSSRVESNQAKEVNSVAEHNIAMIPVQIRFDSISS